MRIRRLIAAALAGAALVGLGGPARAHEEISPETFPIGRSAFLTLIAANESSSDVVRIVLRAPPGLAFGTATRSPAGWTAAVSGTTITWTGGTLKPRTFEAYGFETEGADQPGPFTYEVTSTNAAGRDDTHEVQVTAVAPGGGGSSAGTAPPPNPPTTATPPAVSPTTEVAAPADEDSDGSGLATAALAVSIVALLVAGAALLRGGRGGPPTTGGPGPAAADPVPGGAQDW